MRVPEVKVNVVAKGTCYEDAWRYLLKQEEGELIHGTILRGERLGHAWVDLPTGYIWEPQTGDYYTRKGFMLLFNPQEDHRYTVEEAAKMAVRTGNLGPWTEAERKRASVSSNPAREVGKMKYYYCDNIASHPNNEVIQIKTSEEDPRCPYCRGVMTYGRYWGPLPATQMSGNPTSLHCEEVLERPPKCYDFRGIRSYVMCRAWDIMEKEKRTTLPVGEAWAEARKVCVRD